MIKPPPVRQLPKVGDAFGLDREYYFGNFFYGIFATMDPYFEYKEESTMRRIIRVLNDPIRSLFFERVRQGAVDEELSKKLYELFEGVTEKLSVRE